MRNHRRLPRTSSLPALLCLFAVGCTQPDPIVQNRYAAYEGEAYPNRRTKIAVPPGGIGLVTDLKDDTLSLLDLAQGKFMASYPVGRDPIGLDGPRDVAVDVPAGAVYVVLSYPITLGTGPHAAHLSGTAFGYVQKLALDDLRVVGEVRVESAPGRLALSDDGKRLLVSHFDLQRALDYPDDIEKARSYLAIVDPALIEPVYSDTPRLVRLCVAANGIALSRPDAARAFVACYGEDAVAVVDITDDSAEVQLVPVGSGPTGFPAAPSFGPYATSLSPDGAFVAIGNAISKDVRFFDTASATFDESKTLPTQGTPYFPAWSSDGARLYVPMQEPDALLVVDVTNGNAELAQRVFTKEECELPHAVERFDDARVFVVCEGDHEAPGRVLTLDALTLETLASPEVGAFPTALARVAGGAR